MSAFDGKELIGIPRNHFELTIKRPHLCSGCGEKEARIRLMS